MVKAILLKPLDGNPEGSTMEFSQADFDRLKERGAVKAAPAAKAEPAPENKAAKAPANKSAKSK